MEMDRAEEAFDHDQVPAVRDPGEVEQLKLLAEPGRELVSTLPPAFPRYGGLQLTVCTDSAMEIRDIATV
jgi:hypothetical protein